jgi:hypothetical protein
MTLFTIALACIAASGCVCVCTDVAFETACRERGGRVQSRRNTEVCVADAGVIATWMRDDEDAGR